MKTAQQLAKHFRDVHFGGNWTFVNLKDTMADISWQEATAKHLDFNTIAALLFHINYYVNPVAKVFQGQPLNASDTVSFDCPTITSQEECEHLVQKKLDETIEDVVLFALIQLRERFSSISKEILTFLIILMFLK